MFRKKLFFQAFLISTTEKKFQNKEES